MECICECPVVEVAQKAVELDTGIEIIRVILIIVLIILVLVGLIVGFVKLKNDDEE